EISAANGKPVERRLQDPGAITLLATVRDLDATFARLKRLGAPVVSRGGAPVHVGQGAQQARIVVVKDPGGHFVELVQYDQPQPSQSPATANVTDVRVRLTVEDVDSAVRLYRDALGLRLLNEPRFVEDAAGSSALGVDRGQYRVAFLQVPTSGLMLDLVDFKGADRKTVKAGIQDFGSTRMQIRVRDADAAIAAFAKFGGTVASTGGKSVELPAGNSTLKVVIVRDPNNLFVVLIESPPPAR
ncbi:MAG TPA: VOC family protein, partial [Vicinamibacterales bacterium]|nr:VOC family protein [Vicinamibacterales bacterium]